jgi:3-hydroxyacyl-[acyl-carrier-protein] dehydratase
LRGPQFDPIQLLPHGKAFLFVDEVLSIDGRHVVATRTVPEVEPWTTAHFPGDPLVPGVLLLEGMVQTAGVLGRSVGQPSTKANGRLASIRSAHFLHPVRPGARLTYHAELRTRAGTLYQFDARVEVEGAVVAKASIVLALMVEMGAPS